MAAINAAKHNIIEGGDDVSPVEWLNTLSLSIRDAKPVADAAGRAAVLAALDALGVVPSTSSPIFFYQQDLPAAHRVIWTVDGTNFISTSGRYVWADATARGAATGMSAGSKGVQLDTGVKYTYTGSAWAAWGDAPFAKQVGVTTIAGDGAIQKTAAITFETGLFTIAPRVIVETQVSASGVVIAGAGESVTTSGATIRIARTDGLTFSSSYQVGWRAEQMTPAAATGSLRG